MAVPVLLSQLERVNVAIDAKFAMQAEIIDRIYQFTTQMILQSSYASLSLQPKPHLSDWLKEEREVFELLQTHFPEEFKQEIEELIARMQVKLKSIFKIYEQNEQRLGTDERPVLFGAKELELAVDPLCEKYKQYQCTSSLVFKEYNRLADMITNLMSYTDAKESFDLARSIIREMEPVDFTTPNLP